MSEFGLGVGAIPSVTAIGTVEFTPVLHHPGATNITHHVVATGRMGSHTQPPPQKLPGVCQASMPADLLTSLPQNHSTAPNKGTGEICCFFVLQRGGASVTLSKPAC